MVEYTLQLDSVFHSLADPIRRDILRAVSSYEMSVGQLVERYDVSFAAISKHLKVLEKAHLIQKRKQGTKHMVVLVPQTLMEADAYLEQYLMIWEQKFNKLERLINEGE